MILTTESRLTVYTSQINVNFQNEVKMLRHYTDVDKIHFWFIQCKNDSNQSRCGTLNITRNHQWRT